jgi:hypothetical protein
LQPLILQIDDFCKRLGLACDSRDENQSHVFILTGNNNDQAITTASMLLGAFLVLRRGLTVKTVMAAFHEIKDRFVPIERVSSDGERRIITVHDCWQALAHALRLGWFVPPASDAEPVLDVEELVHYASAANGRVRVVVPGALLFFPTPSDDIPDGREWADTAAAEGRPAARRFSPGYYASLLADLGVSSAACLGRGSPAATQALAARGVSSVNLRLPVPAHGAAAASAAGALLPALDRLLALARAGAVGVHCGAGCEWPAHSLGTLAAAFLISRFGFSGPEAAAWVLLVAS